MPVVLLLTIIKRILLHEALNSILDAILLAKYGYIAGTSEQYVSSSLQFSSFFTTFSMTEIIKSVAFISRDFQCSSD